MQLGFTKAQILKVLKVGAWIAVSAFLDYVISQTSGTQFGMLTPVINFVLVTLKQFVSKES